MLKTLVNSAVLTVHCACCWVTDHTKAIMGVLTGAIYGASGFYHVHIGKLSLVQCPSCRDMMIKGVKYGGHTCKSLKNSLEMFCLATCLMCISSCWCFTANRFVLHGLWKKTTGIKKHLIIVGAILLWVPNTSIFMTYELINDRM